MGATQGCRKSKMSTAGRPRGVTPEGVVYLALAGRETSHDDDEHSLDSDCDTARHSAGSMCEGPRTHLRLAVVVAAVEEATVARGTRLGGVEVQKGGGHVLQSKRRTAGNARQRVRRKEVEMNSRAVRRVT